MSTAFLGKDDSPCTTVLSGMSVSYTQWCKVRGQLFEINDPVKSILWRYCPDTTNRGRYSKQVTLRHKYMTSLTQTWFCVRGYYMNIYLPWQKLEDVAHKYILRDKSYGANGIKSVIHNVTCFYYTNPFSVRTGVL